MSEEKITWQSVPHGYVLCIHADCPLAEHCLRAMAMAVLPNSMPLVTIANPTSCTKDTKCPHYKNDEPLRYAKGFTGLQQKLLPQQYKLFMHRLTHIFGRNEYFRRRRGERPMPPAEQAIIQQVLRETGFTEELEFDSYEMNTAWDD